MAERNIRSPWSLAWKTAEAVLAQFTPETAARLIFYVVQGHDAFDERPLHRLSLTARLLLRELREQERLELSERAEHIAALKAVPRG